MECAKDFQYYIHLFSLSLKSVSVAVFIMRLTNADYFNQDINSS